MNEIITRAEQTAVAEPEPTFTLSQLRGLLREATAYERAANPAPIVLHSSPAPATAPQTAVHDGIDVRVPVTTAQAAHAPSERNAWPIVFMVSGCTGLAACATAAATGNQFAILALFAAVAAWGTATYHLVFLRES
jgi:hypothetical protein